MHDITTVAQPMIWEWLFSDNELCNDNNRCLPSLRISVKLWHDLRSTAHAQDNLMPYSINLPRSLKTFQPTALKFPSVGSEFIIALYQAGVMSGWLSERLARWEWIFPKPCVTRHNATSRLKQTRLCPSPLALEVSSFTRQSQYSQTIYSAQFLDARCFV